MFINLYKELEELSAVPFPRDGFKAALINLKDKLRRSLQWHTLRKVKVEIPDIELTTQQNREVSARCQLSVQ
jgi:hypothetical protein